LSLLFIKPILCLCYVYCDVEVHSLDYATAYCDVSIDPMAVRFNGEKFPHLSHTDDKFFIIIFLHFTIAINGALGLYKASMFNI